MIVFKYQDIVNFKFEIRISKYETNLKFKIQMSKTILSLGNDFCFDHWVIEI
jgi:hypothetical protein